VRTPDISINSRSLLRDLIATSVHNGLDISTRNTIEKIEKESNYKLLIGSKENIQAQNVALCNGAGIKNFSDVKIKESFAPIAVVSGVPENTKSFVELDYYLKNCINLLTKEDGYGLAGGISLSKKSDCDEYLNYVMRQHKKLTPTMKELSRYVGVKTEITFKNQLRGYLYHIVNTDENVWAVIPGKFTLAFSMAPEFYRRVYEKNPRKYFKTVKADKESNAIVSNTVWKDIFNK
jgi:hypothetical protein